jgi:hypothetical protein
MEHERGAFKVNVADADSRARRVLRHGADPLSAKFLDRRIILLNY